MTTDSDQPKLDLSKPQSFRWGNPPKQVIEHLEKLKRESSSKKFSSWIPHYISLGVELELNEGKPHILVPLDSELSKEELDFFQSDYAKNLLSILFKAITKDPSKAFQFLETKQESATETHEQKSAQDEEEAAQEDVFKILEDNADEFDLGF